MTELLWTVAKKDAPVFLFAHGAGAPMDSVFMDAVARLLAEHGVSVARFEFPYMAARRADGKKRPPDRQPRLLNAFREAATEAGGLEHVFVGGKSMGGRMATLLAAETPCRGVICFGYPFHPPGKPETLRIAHLETKTVPTLICQGERDPFGRREEVEDYPLSRAIAFQWAPDGDHDLKPRKTSGHTHDENLREAVAAAAAFIHEHCRSQNATECPAGTAQVERGHHPSELSEQGHPAREGRARRPETGRRVSPTRRERKLTEGTA